MKHLRTSVPTALGLLACAACLDSAGVAGTLWSEVVDSAGVTVVSNQAPPIGSRMAWQLADQPSLQIGAVDGNAEDQLFEVVAASRLADGRLLVANRGTSEVRVFDASGVYVESWGGEGEGPGEFTGLSDLAAWSADSILVWDNRQHRVSIFDAQGEIGRSFSLSVDAQLGPAALETVLPDGSILVATQVSYGGGEARSGLVRRFRKYARLDADGELLASYGSHLGAEAYISVGESFLAVLRHPYQRSAFSAAWGEWVVISSNESFELRCYDTEGVLRRVVRRDHELKPVSRGHIDAYLEERLAAAEPAARPRLAEMSEDLPPVESFPAFSALLVDAVGYLWVRDYVLPGEADHSVWTVFDHDGRVQGSVETPDGLEVFQIGYDYILGRATDDLDVEYVQLWSLLRRSESDPPGAQVEAGSRRAP